MREDPSPFRFKCFDIHQANSSQKLGTDAVFLGASASFDNPRRILDVGTGTGILALMLAQRYPESEIDGIELNPNSLLDADYNFRKSPWKHRLKAIAGRVQDHRPQEKYDLIVSNPPYFNEDSRSSDAGRDQARHTESLPLPELMSACSRMMNEKASLQIVFPASKQGELIWQASLKLLYPEKRISLISVKDKVAERVILAFSKNAESKLTEEEWHIYLGASADQSLRYRRSLGEFYLYL